ncbi:MAG: iron-containing alcohol dehydrogenase, partial [Candidatus Electrothrix sp. AR3]|nr:iron-containing alcohol dehydrogenase [Candidatus Electrothrix sp. AR3]
MAAVGFVVPRVTYHGIGTLEKLKELDGTKAFIVTGGSSMKNSGVLQKAQAFLKESGISSSVFEGVEPDPSIETVMQGAEKMNQEQPDLIVGLGGCSAIDAAKAMWSFYEHPETTLEEIIPPFSIKPLRNKAKFVAVPSTSGTGTEVTCVSVITDRKKGVKYPLVSYELTPDVAIVDGEICVSMPPDVTAHTGLDALAHNTEAYVSSLADPYTDPLVKQSIEMIFKFLPVAYKEPDNLEARQAMHDASCLAGIAFTNALLGIVHAMAHQLGGMFGIPHGCANAILMPNVVRYNSSATKKYEDLAGVVGKETAEDYAVEIENLRAAVNVPASVKDYGVFESDWNGKLDEITGNAMADPCVGANPRTPTKTDIRRIYECCYNGMKV